MTDFENAALTTFVAMLVNIINTFDLDFIIPMTLVNENIKRAHLKSAVTSAKFYIKIPKGEFKNISRISDVEDSNFLKSNTSDFGKPNEKIYNSQMPVHNHDNCHPDGQKEDAKRVKELSIAQLLEGDAAIGLPKGLLTLAEEYMEINDWDDENIEIVMCMLNFL